MVLNKLGNYKLLILSSSVAAFAGGLFAPFWILFIKDFGGGLELFGMAIGLMVIAESATAYFAGKYSDRLGRKIFMILSGFLGAAVIFAYTIITVWPYRMMNCDNVRIFLLMKLWRNSFIHSSCVI